MREGHFALLIPSKWEFSKEYVQTIKRLLQVAVRSLYRFLVDFEVVVFRMYRIFCIVKMYNRVGRK